jgi:hypothetical protein
MTLHQFCTHWYAFCAGVTLSFQFVIWYDRRYP